MHLAGWANVASVPSPGVLTTACACGSAVLIHMPCQMDMLLCMTTAETSHQCDLVH